MADMPVKITDPRVEPVRIWGLDASTLHEAHWRSKGVQCVRRGCAAAPARGTELFMLLEPGQLVLFELRAMTDRLAWRSAALTRLRVVDHEEGTYRERVRADARGRVLGVDREYWARTRSSYRILLTRHWRVAREWAAGLDRRTTWKRLRDRVGHSNIDVWHCPGWCAAAGDVTDEARLVEALVETWPRPDVVIDGIVEADPRVWCLAADAERLRDRCLGPAWIGALACDEDPEPSLLIGPAWHGDVASDAVSAASVRIRSIREVEPVDPVPGEPRSAPRSNEAYLRTKRLLDIAMSGFLLLVLAPLILAIALLVLLDDGWPLLFGHVRQTRGGRDFHCWKFRTMHRNAEQIKQQLIADNRCDGPQFYIPDDPRVTRVGRLLRRFHLDELPQLWNVFVGDMSLVGPRPSPDAENQICPAWREIRLSVRPGITGLWQLERTRQAGTDFQEWIHYDVQYVEQASLGMDLRILCRTFWSVLFKE
ncbi:MAG: sugar transferase [Planctomycetes bacterium]|nr:sugar transferase [Planctomycetota bacterium]